MDEFFDKDYFYGKIKSNYVCYDKINSKIYFKEVIRFIEKYNKGGRYLDVGCAFGFLIHEVAPFFDETYGCDVSAYAIERAKEIVPKSQLEVIDLDTAFPYPRKYFDVVTALDVLEHTHNLDKNFQKISSSVKDDGYLIISLPIEDWPRKIFGFLDKDKSHISIPHEDNLIKLIKDNRFEILDKSYFAPMPYFYKVPHIPAEVELFLHRKKY